MFRHYRVIRRDLVINTLRSNNQGKGKAILLQVWTVPEGSRSLSLPYSGMVSALRTGRLYLPGNIPVTHFC